MNDRFTCPQNANRKVLGMSFLADNDFQLVLEGGRNVMTGSLTVLAS